MSAKPNVRPLALLGSTCGPLDDGSVAALDRADELDDMFSESDVDGVNLVELAAVDAVGLPLASALLDASWAVELGDAGAGAVDGVGSGAAVGDEHPETPTNRPINATQHTVARVRRRRGPTAADR